jgi:hypothetical protein
MVGHTSANEFIQIKANCTNINFHVFGLDGWLAQVASMVSNIKIIQYLYFIPLRGTFSRWQGHWYTCTQYAGLISCIEACITEANIIMYQAIILTPS